jgi:cell division septum initiation protein DivIVA
MLAEAKREAERILEEARERRTQLVSRHELIRQDECAARDIIDDTRAWEREIRLGAEEYAAEILDTLEATSPGSSPPSNAAASVCTAPDEAGEVE